MTKSIRVNEYYDLFDVYLHPDDYLVTDIQNLPNSIAPTNEYNGFRGFSNWPNFYDNNKTLTTPPATYTANNVIEITGKHKSSQANNTLRIDDNGDIYCYPPNVSVPYWSRLIFRNFDYSISNSDWVKNNIDNTFVKNIKLDSKFESVPMIGDNSLHGVFPLPSSITIKATDVDVTNGYEYNGAVVTAGQDMTFILWNTNTAIYTNNDVYPTNFKSEYRDKDFTSVNGYSSDVSINGTSIDYSTVPLFLRFDEYQSRSKVIFSGVDKTRNPDIEFNFGYKKGQMEPIKLNLSLSAGIPLRDPATEGKYNQNLSKAQIELLLSSCYWCVEWICDLDAGN